MGGAIAHALSKDSSFKVSVYERTREKGEALKKECNISLLSSIPDASGYGSCIPIGSDMGLEHKVEVSWFCKCSLVSPHWAWSVKVDLVSAET